MTLYSPFVTGQPTTFRALRFLQLAAGFMSGVYAAADFAVSQRGAGANMSVDVAAGNAFVTITTGTRNGVAHVINDAVVNLVIGANASGLPRIDQVFLQYNDAGIPAGVGGNVPTIRVVAGTPTSGATLANQLGAAAQPADTLKLASILVANGAASILNASIQDARPLMFGNRLFIGSSGARSDFTRSTVSSLLPEMSVTGVFSAGRPVDLELQGAFNPRPAAGGEIYLEFRRNGTLIHRRPMIYAPSAITDFNYEPWSFRYTDISPPPGRNTYEVWWFVSPSTSSEVTRLNEANGSWLSVIERAN